MQLSEILNEAIKYPIKIETDTGTASLNQDGSIDLNNSGYKQHLNNTQVRKVWKGAKVLLLNKETIAELKAEYPDDPEEMKKAVELMTPKWDGDYWDFGEEQHQIPSKNEFLENPSDS